MAEKSKILVMDDVIHIVKVIECRLKASGYQVVTESHEANMLYKVKREKPDLIFLDVMMSQQNSGLIILSKIKQDESIKHIPVIMLTAKGSEEDIKKAIRLGATDYIIKPFDSTVVLEKIKKYLARV